MQLNLLKAMLDRGEITPEQLSNMMLGGEITDAPTVPRETVPASALPPTLRMPQAGMNQWGARGTGVVQRDDAAPIYINPTAPQAQSDAGWDADVSRPMVEAFGKKGYYSKDGKWLLQDNADGTQSRTALNFDGDKFRANQDRAAKMAQAAATLAKTQAETRNLDLKPVGPPQARPDKPHYDSERGMMVGIDADGNPYSKPVPGVGAKPKATTEDENKAAGYAVRMETALKTATDLSKKSPGDELPDSAASLASKVPFAGDYLENALNSPVRRQIQAAQLDALDAALALSTGAAYTKEQLKNLSRSYFPQLNDDPETVEKKRELFSNAVATARIRAGRAAGNIDKVLDGNKLKPLNLSPAKASKNSNGWTVTRVD